MSCCCCNSSNLFFFFPFLLFLVGVPISTNDNEGSKGIVENHWSLHNSLQRWVCTSLQIMKTVLVIVLRMVIILIVIILIVIIIITLSLAATEQLIVSIRIIGIFIVKIQWMVVPKLLLSFRVAAICSNSHTMEIRWHFGLSCVSSLSVVLQPDDET